MGALGDPREALLLTRHADHVMSPTGCLSMCQRREQGVRARNDSYGAMRGAMRYVSAI